MFGVGFGELTLILVIALVALGPQEAARNLKRLRKLMLRLNELRHELEAQISDKFEKQ